MDFYSLLHVSKGNKHHAGSSINNPKELKDRDFYLQMAQGLFFSFHSLYLLQLSLCRSWVHKINPVSAQRLGSLDNRKPLALIISQLFAFCATVEIKCSPRSRLSAASTEVSAWASGLIYTTICGGIISVISQTYVFQSSHICWCGSRTYW